jgi:hypothetical protein
MEEWSASEANLFEEALEKYGKDFNDIRQDFVSKMFYTWLNEMQEPSKPILFVDFPVVLL